MVRIQNIELDLAPAAEAVLRRAMELAHRDVDFGSTAILLALIEGDRTFSGWLSDIADLGEPAGDVLTRETDEVLLRALVNARTDGRPSLATVDLLAAMLQMEYLPCWSGHPPTVLTMLRRRAAFQTFDAWAQCDSLTEQSTISEAMTEVINNLGHAQLLITGAPGTGRTSLARIIAGDRPAVLVDGPSPSAEATLVRARGAQQQKIVVDDADGLPRPVLEDLLENRSHTLVLTSLKDSLPTEFASGTLNVCRLPEIDARRADLLGLVEHFSTAYRRHLDALKLYRVIPPPIGDTAIVRAIDMGSSLSWPDNLRSLQRRVESVILLGGTDRIALARRCIEDDGPPDADNAATAPERVPPSSAPDIVSMSGAHRASTVDDPVHVGSPTLEQPRPAYQAPTDRPVSEAGDASHDVETSGSNSARREPQEEIVPPVLRDTDISRQAVDHPDPTLEPTASRHRQLSAMLAHEPAASMDAFPPVKERDTALVPAVERDVYELANLAPSTTESDEVSATAKTPSRSGVRLVLITLVYVALIGGGIAAAYHQRGLHLDAEKRLHLVKERAIDCPPEPIEPGAAAPKVAPEPPAPPEPQTPPVITGRQPEPHQLPTAFFASWVDTISPRYETETMLDDVIGRGEITVVNLWAEWCKPCIDELPLFKRAFANRERDWERVKFLPINIALRRGSATAVRREFIEKMPAHVKERGNHFLVSRLLGFEAALREQGLYQGELPVTFILDCRRRVRWLQLSEVKQESEFARVVDELVAELSSESGPCCGDGHCGAGERAKLCRRDCCVQGDGECVAACGETRESTPRDCGCGNGRCERRYESRRTCQEDCGCPNIPCKANESCNRRTGVCVPPL